MPRAVLVLLALSCTSEPLLPMRAEIVEQNLARFDPDKDGAISPSEFGEMHQGGLSFDDFDENRDGQIDAAELDRQIALREPRPLMDLKSPMGEHPHIEPHSVVERPGRTP